MKTFKEYTTKNSASFDFDDTIFLLKWDDEENDYQRDEKGHAVGVLNKAIAQKIKDHKMDGDNVYVVTSRYDGSREEVEDFLKNNNLWGYIDDVHFTNGAWKANRLKKLGVHTHYDDDPGELRRLGYKGIKGIKVADKPDEDSESDNGI